MHISKSADFCKIAVVTGASSGLGKAAALGLAKQHIKVLMICKDETRGIHALREIQTQSGNPHVALVTMDLSCQKSLHLLADKICKEVSHVDILIHAAGVLQPKRIVTTDGLEMTFATNHLAPFLLTHTDAAS